MNKNATNKVHHRWTNDPDLTHRKCLICGIRMQQKTIKSKTIRIYTLNDGTQTEQIPDCITPINWNEL